ncbi:MAG: M24 family metallopeptidase [Planctomycetaceae bacterium]|nr:M24 family metallopeptidase [Planctomycetaceae bacterium]
MAPLTLAPAQPVSSGEIGMIDPHRADEVDRRHQQVAEFLSSARYDALLLTLPHNFAWITAGGEGTRPGSNEMIAAAFITPDARVMLTGSVDSGHLFDQVVNGLGFQLKERPWHEERSVLLEDLCRGRKVASDSGMFLTDNFEPHLVRFRVPLPEFDRPELRRLGRHVAHAVEATARTFSQGETEAEVAGQLAHRLMRHEITPVRLQVMADGQGHRYRHWGYGSDRIERTCVISAIGRRKGLHVGATRTVTFGQPTKSIADTHHLAAIVQTTGMFFSQVGWTVSDTWSRVARIYEKFGAPDGWRQAEQAEGIGYAIEEFAFEPGSRSRLRTGTPIFWHPSVRTAAVGDTMLVHDEGFELLTPSENWPELTVEVKGSQIRRPSILIRESSTDWPDQ